MTTLLFKPVSFIQILFMHLWLSVSSIKFYENVFKNYKDYGLLYILNLSLISSIMCSVIFLSHIDKIRNYLNHNIISEETENIDFVISQLPPIEFDGQKISINEETPLYIKNKNDIKIVAIDPSNKIKPSDRDKIPVILTADKMILKMLDSEQKVQNTFPVQFDKFFGETPRIFTQIDIKAIFAKLFDQAPRIFIYLIFPITGFLIFFNTFLDKSLFIVLIFLVSRATKINLTMKTCIRLAMYASGFYAISQFVFLLVANDYSTIVWLIQTWSNILMILGILSATGKSYIFGNK
jgi:hypothetical protein